MASTKSYEPTQPSTNSRAYLSQVPSVAVPPADYDYATGEPVLHLKTPPDRHMLRYPDGKYGDPNHLLQLASTKPSNLDAKQYQWSFDMRRKAQAITPFIYLGPSTSLKDTAFLDSTGITFLLAVRSGKAARSHPNYLNPSTSPAAIDRQTATFDVDSSYDFIINVKSVIKSVIDHLQAGTEKSFISMKSVKAKILVCCETGNDRSAAFVAALLMVIYGCSAHEAEQVIYAQRVSVSVEEEMRRMLLTLEGILAAERQVITSKLGDQEQSFSSNNAHTISSKKRGHEDYDMDDDEEMGESDKLQMGEETRAGIAPFADIDW